MSTPSGIPKGFGPVTPYLIIDSPAEAIAFYAEAFGAKERLRLRGPGGQGVMHAELELLGAAVIVAGEFPGMDHARSPKTLGATTGAVHLYVAHVDQVFERAVQAGAEPLMPPTDMFWGDRFAKVRDPFGHEWSIATQVRSMTPAEVQAAADAALASMGEPGSC